MVEEGKEIYKNKINMTETKVFILVRGWKFATAVRKKVSETRVFGKYWKTCRFRL